MLIKHNRAAAVTLTDFSLKASMRVGIAGCADILKGLGGVAADVVVAIPKCGRQTCQGFFLCRADLGERVGSRQAQRVVLLGEGVRPARARPT